MGQDPLGALRANVEAMESKVADVRSILVAMTLGTNEGADVLEAPGDEEEEEESETDVDAEDTFNAFAMNRNTRKSAHSRIETNNKESAVFNDDDPKIRVPISHAKANRTRCHP